jgi:hypothetical protein
MAEIRLTRTELAALDLLIAQMEEGQAGATAGSAAVQYTPVLARVAYAYTATAWLNRIVFARYTPVILDYPPLPTLQGDISRMAGAAGALTPGLSLSELLELRKQVTAEGA